MFQAARQGALTVASRVLGAGRHHPAQNLRVIRNELVRTDSRETAYNCGQIGVEKWIGIRAPYLSLTSLNEIGCRPFRDSLIIHPLEKDANAGPGT